LLRALIVEDEYGSVQSTVFGGMIFFFWKEWYEFSVTCHPIFWNGKTLRCDDHYTVTAVASRVFPYLGTCALAVGCCSVAAGTQCCCCIDPVTDWMLWLSSGKRWNSTRTWVQAVGRLRLRIADKIVLAQQSWQRSAYSRDVLAGCTTTRRFWSGMRALRPFFLFGEWLAKSNYLWVLPGKHAKSCTSQIRDQKLNLATSAVAHGVAYVHEAYGAEHPCMQCRARSPCRNVQRLVNAKVPSIPATAS
jgi:hypothetical protein